MNEAELNLRGGGSAFAVAVLLGGDEGVDCLSKVEGAAVDVLFVGEWVFLVDGPFVDDVVGTGQSEVGEVVDVREGHFAVLWTAFDRFVDLSDYLEVWMGTGLLF